MSQAQEGPPAELSAPAEDSPTVLIATSVSHEGAVAKFLPALEWAHVAVTEAPPDLALVRLVAGERPDGVVLDLSGREVDGIELVRTLRTISDVPVVVLANRPDADLNAGAFDAGADDVLPYDIAPIEFSARLRARLRNRPASAGRSTSDVVRTGDIEIDRAAMRVRKRGALVPLSPTEYRVLDALAARPDEVVSPASIYRAAWGADRQPKTPHVRIYIGYLRHKLEDDHRQPRYLVTRWGLGYLLALLPSGPDAIPPAAASQAGTLSLEVVGMDHRRVG